MNQSPCDRVRTWRNRHLRDTLFLRADFRQQRFDRHFHEEFAIGVIDGGCQAFVYDRSRRLDMPQGTVALIAPGMIHLGWPGSEEGWRYRMLYPAEDVVRETATDIFGSSTLATFDRPVVEDPLLYARLLRLHTASESPDVDALEIGALYLEVVGHAFAQHAGRRLPANTAIHDRGMRAVREAIATCYAETLTLADLAARAGLSKFHLLRQFKLTHGLPPHAYLRQIRVQRARALILAGATLAGAAMAVGFADQAHMTRAFRRSLGYTPGALARA